MHAVEPHPSPSPSQPKALDVLLARVGRGDREAFGGVYAAVAGAILGIARRILTDPAQAEQVCQEALLDVWRRAASFDPARGSARAWILTLAHRHAVQHARTTTAATPDTLPTLDPLDETGQPTPLHDCLAALTPAQRDSLLLAYYRGRTHHQCADRLDLPHDTAKIPLRDGLIRLRDCASPA